MLLDMLGTANSARVLAALRKLGGKARFTDIRNTVRLGDSQVSRALKDFNKRGFVAGRPARDRTMSYAVTKAGSEAMALTDQFHDVVHEQPGSVAQAADRELEDILAI